MPKVRIATTADNEIFLVNSIDFRRREVLCWGHVTRRDGCRTTHAKSKRFPLDAVKIEEVEHKPSLYARLFDQTLNRLAANGEKMRTHARDGRRLKRPILADRDAAISNL